MFNEPQVKRLKDNYPTKYEAYIPYHTDTILIYEINKNYEST